MVLKPLKPILVVLGVVLVILELVLMYVLGVLQPQRVLPHRVFVVPTKGRGLAAQRLTSQGTLKVEEATHPSSQIVYSLGS